MAKLSSNKAFFPKSFLVLMLSALLFSGALHAQDQSTVSRQLESNIAIALKKNIVYKTALVQMSLKTLKAIEIERLVVKLESVELGQITADYMTVMCENPIIDLKKLKKDKDLEFRSYGKMRVSIFVSAASLEKYLQRKAQQFNKKNVQISLKFTPPYIECFYDVPKNEIASESVDLLKKFIKGDKIEGYAAFQLSVKDNGMYASSSKVITNHFLLPNSLLNIFQSRFNPFDEIAVIKPFQYSINNVTIQSKYVYMTN